MSRPYPPLDRGIQWRSIRNKIDRFFVDEIRRLEDAFYGTPEEWDEEGLATRRSNDGWRHGASHPYVIGGRTFDAQANATASKTLFDRLHGALWQLHELCLIVQAEIDESPVATALRYRERWDPDPTDPGKAQRKVIVDLKTELKSAIRDARQARIDLTEVVPASIRQTLVSYLNA